MAEHDKNETRKEYKEFRELLRKGIGLRTQKEFASTVGISPAYLNKMLKNDLIPTPTRETLNNIAKHMPSIKKEDLLKSCGYEALSAQEEADMLAHDISNFLNKDGCWVTHDTMDGVFDTIDMLYTPQGFDKIRCTVLSDKKAKMDDAENVMDVVAVWENDDMRCEATYRIYYSKTVGNNLIIFKTMLCQNDDGTFVKIKDKSAINRAKDIFLYGAFGYTDFETDEVLPDTLVGPGLPYDKTPAGFKDFLSNHKASFCTTKERCALWERVVVNGEDPDIVFKDFSDGPDAYGTGSVVAAILKEETKGLKCMDDYDAFRYYAPCMKIEESLRNSFVMAADPYKSECLHKDINMHLYAYAKELKLDGFGLCYYHSVLEKSKGSWYTLNQFAEFMR